MKESLLAKVSPVSPSSFFLLGSILLIFLYPLWVGWERFYYESWGTWVLSPVIYSRILPDPAGAWLAGVLLKYPHWGYLLCGAPLLLLGVAFAAAVVGFQKKSLLASSGCFCILLGILTIYHHLQPMGLTVMYLD